MKLWYLLLACCGLGACKPPPELDNRPEIEVYQLFGLTEGLEPVDMLLPRAGSELVILNNADPRGATRPTLVGTELNGTGRWTQELPVPDENFRYVAEDLYEGGAAGLYVCGTALRALDNAGTVETYPFLFHTDYAGRLIWSRLYVGLSGRDLGRAVTGAVDGEGLAVTGSRRTGEVSDFLLLQTDAEGNLVQVTVQGTDQENQYGTDLAVEAGEYWVFGSTFLSAPAAFGLRLQKLSPDGTPLGGPAVPAEGQAIAARLLRLPDGYLWVGNVYPDLPPDLGWPPVPVPDSAVRYFLVEVGLDLNLRWTQTGAPGIRARDAVGHPEGGFSLLCDTLSGNGESGLYVVELTATGEVISGRGYGYNGNETGGRILAPTPGTLLISGATEAAGLRKTMYLRLRREVAAADE
ncbi:MAG: hypothetical protein AAF998_23835 [Bacteroidota bacterium]